MFGLQNVSGSCWVNTCIQSVYRLPEAQTRYTENKAEGDLDTALQTIWNSKGVMGLTELFAELQKERVQAGRTIGDSHELMHHLCDKLPWLDTMFRFKIADVITCDHCNAKTTKEDTTIEMTLFSAVRNQSILDSIRNVVTPSKIAEWKCEACKETGCTKQILIGSFPKLFMFRVHGEPMRYDTTMILNQRKYALSSVMCHNGGHWWMYGRDMPPGTPWVTLNDRNVTQHRHNEFPVSPMMRVLIYYRLND